MRPIMRYLEPLYYIGIGFSIYLNFGATYRPALVGLAFPGSSAYEESVDFPGMACLQL